MRTKIKIIPKKPKWREIDSFHKKHDKMNSETKSNRSLLGSIEALEKATSDYSTDEKKRTFNSFKAQQRDPNAELDELFDDSLSRLLNVCIYHHAHKRINAVTNLSRYVRW